MYPPSYAASCNTSYKTCLLKALPTRALEAQINHPTRRCRSTVSLSVFCTRA